MANLRVIAEIKPAGDFPVVDAPNVSVTGGKRLDVALSEAAAEVAKKANKSEVDTALASKANKSEVDATLAGKANKSEVDAAIENKADKSAFEAINASVSVNTSNIQELSTESTVLSARMDEFTKLEEGSTTGDAELIDGRIGSDGKTYDNIGGAIRGQVTDLKSDLSHVENIIGKEETYSEPSGTREVGFYSISKFNTLTYNTTYSSITYPVGKSTKAKVTAVTNTAKGFSAVLFLDDSYGLVSHALDWNESEAVTYIDELISIPQNASYIRIVGYTKTGISPIAKLNNTTLGTRLDDIESDINKLKEKDNPHKDDVWVCFGDSITGKYTTPCIPDMIAERFGCTIYNVGFSGTRAVKRKSTAYQYFDFQAIADAVVSGDFSLQDANVGETISSYVERLNTLKSIDFSKVTHAYFFYGTNDFNGSQKIVSMKNALIDGISRILTAYPNITPVIITPMFRFKVVDGTVVFLDDSTWVAYEDKTLVSYINGVEEVGNENYIPVINLLKTLGITKYNYTKWFNISDGTHPSEEGIILIGKSIAEQLYKLF